jgi:hypothetical protein
MRRLGVMKEHPKSDQGINTFDKGVGLLCSTLDTILSSTINKVGRTYVMI